MNRLAFEAARLLRREGPLAALSVSAPALLADLAGRHVALVGNARALAASDHGARIDAADLVIRINRAPQPDPRSHGRRTDWLALATRLPEADRARLNPGRILWMSAKRKRLDWTTARSPGFYLHPLRDIALLGDRLGAKPTTGAMMIELCLRGDPASVTLYGFDFFASLSLSGRRAATAVPHDFAAEAAWVADLMRHDPRLRRVG